MAATEQPARQSGFALPLALRFFLGTAILIALAVGAAIVVTYLQGQRIAAQAVDKALETSTAVQREVEQRRSDKLQASVRLIAADASFVKYIADATGAGTLPGLGGDASPDTMSMRDLLAERQKEFDFNVGVLLDAKGDVLARTDQTEAFKENLAADPFIAPALKEGKPFSDYWRHADRLYQAVIMPLAQDDNLAGFVLIADEVDAELARKMAQVGGVQVTYWLPRNSHLELVATSLDAAAANELKAAITDTPELLKPMMEGRKPARINLRFAGQDWVARVAPTSDPKETNLGVVMSLASADQIAASYRAIQNWVLAAGLASMVAALLLSFLFSKGILRPVSAMAKAAEDAAAGNYQTRLGTEGKDELARLARAFDSLLSDLREKSDMEGYVGNLARFLPEPGQEGAAPAVELRTKPMGEMQLPKREPLAILGLEFRHLLTLPADMPAEQVIAASARVRHALDTVVAHVGGKLKPGVGARWLLVYGGATRRHDALTAWRALLEAASSSGVAAPAAALADGDLVSASAGDTQELIGATLVQVDRLLCDAAPNQLLLSRNAGEAIKGELGIETVVVAQGGFSSKQYYALDPSALTRLPLPAVAIEAGATVVNLRSGGEATTPRPIERITRTDPGELAPGTTLGGRYRVLSVLGAGGMGMVYKAHDLELDDVVALKMLKPGALLDAEQLDRLKSEIKLARKITHPNVLRTFDFGEVNGLPYISMEYVRGLTLRYLLREAKRVPYSAGLRIARQLAAGLAAAHEVGVLHRDIKPENLILEASGNAKLMDFGIARPARRTVAGHTQPGTFLGTPNYCAPEQLAGEEVDERADIYSCGVLMTEMFCGALPFSGNNTMEIYIAQMQQAPTKPSALWPEIRPELEAIILRCLERNPAERYASATVLASALTQLRA